MSSQTNGSVRRAGVTRQQRDLARRQFAALLWPLLLAGWNDGTIGPLLPRIQKVYHVHISHYTWPMPFSSRTVPY